MLENNELLRIKQAIGREPTRVEIAMFDSMWSEHCSYKSSKQWFRLFAGVKSKRVKLGIGEGAGLVDIGHGQLIGLALESHNHPSAIDPFNGAATGVGGIIRDVISQGCHPIALLDSLRFGNLEDSRNRYLLENVVRGISSYGNCVGVPNIGGDVVFDQSYSTNCLVNVMCIGLVEEDKVIRSRASNPGDKLVIFGSRTGRDGIGGVSFASENLTIESEKDRPAVQIGDPATEKIIIDVINELVSKDLINGMQDLGGGGFTCASSEIVHTAHRGAKLNIDCIPLREEGMDYWEIMISESQERMLIAVDPGKLDAVLEVLTRHELYHGVVGEVLAEDRYLVVNSAGETLADIPASLLVDGFRVHDHPLEKPEELKHLTKIRRGKDSLESYLSRIFDSPSLGDKSFIFNQYDRHVQIRTIVEAGDNAGVLDIGHGKAIGAVLDANDYQVLLDPRKGTINAVLRCYGKLNASGLEPIALVDCLNFGNPEKKDSYWQYVESVHGLGVAVKQLQIPVIGGNVSFYNESEIGGKRYRINPTPVIGMLGMTKDKNKISRGKVNSSSSTIIIIGDTTGDLDGSEAVRFCENITDGLIPDIDIPEVQKQGIAVRNLVEKGLITSAVHVSRGGLFGSIAKMLFGTDYGAKISTDSIPLKYGVDPSITEILFSESPGRYLLTLDPSNTSEISLLLDEQDIKHGVIGTTTANRYLAIDGKKIDLDTLEKQWKQAIPGKLVV
ncbi:MAG: phosphoribosylformylglycinamidine synthase subunit PurL [Candidatus Hodarchaeales archaeon]